jgi:hypothetical protein
MTSGQDTWSARCVETCTAGAAGGPGKPTRSNPGRAPRSDPTGTAMVIHIWDASDEVPVVKDFAADDETGRGLFLVVTLSHDWGFYRKAEGGKVVWAMLTSDPR